MLASGFVVRTSEESCFKVCVKFLLASAKAFVSNFGFFAGGSPVSPSLTGRQKASACGVGFTGGVSVCGRDAVRGIEGTDGEAEGPDEPP